MTTEPTPLPILDWHGCYDEQWSQTITKDSFGHPAKFSKRLIERIYDHLLERGYVQPGDLVGDPFGGVALGGIAAAYRGLRWVGVELEQKFVNWGRGNINRHKHKLNYLGKPLPVLLEGDSRQFAARVGEHSQAVVSSPPYATIAAGAGGLNTKPAHHPGQQSGRSAKSASQTADQRYGQTPGQIAGTAEGTVDGVVCSPPFAGTSGQGGGGINKRGYIPAEGRKWTRPKPDPVGSRTYQGQGADRQEGNIEVLAEGTVDGVVTSPPWGSNCEGGRQVGRFANPDAVLASSRGHGATDAAVLAQAERDAQKTYGETAGNIGNTQKETYWSAMLQVYAQCYIALKPGGVIAIVVKDYCKDRKRVRLCDDTLRLLEHVGFIPVERVRAHLVSKTTHQDMFAGEVTVKRERKSFFRRVHEKTLPEGDERRIDFEEVLICRKP